MKRSRLDALIMEQERLNKLDRATIEAIQLKKLNRLLAREKKRKGFYRELSERLVSLSRLEDLPLTTDEDLARHAPSILLSSQSEVQRVLSDATSGTTGTAKRVFYTDGDLENTIQLYVAGLGELVFPGSVTMICFPFSGPFGLGELISEAIERLGARPLKLGPALRFEEYGAVMARERPDTYVGMPVHLLSLLRVCGKGSLQRALVSGDACPESVIRGCEAILETGLYPHYGSREMGMAGAITCPAHKGMHLRENHVIAEVIDPNGKVLPKGEYGELVVTTIGMEALPLIRYRTGDYTRILPDPCPCGSELIRLDSVSRLGREGEMESLDNALFSLEELVDFHVSRSHGVLSIRAMTAAPLLEEQIRSRAAALYPNTEIRVSVSAAEGHSSALYRGKRRVEDAP